MRANNKQVGTTEESLLFSVTDGNITDLGFAAQSLIARCQFNNQRCTHVNFTR